MSEVGTDSGIDVGRSWGSKSVTHGHLGHFSKAAGSRMRSFQQLARIGRRLGRVALVLFSSAFLVVVAMALVVSIVSILLAADLDPSYSVWVRGFVANIVPLFVGLVMILIGFGINVRRTKAIH